ncbi:uncharacterized protein LOC134188660 [Corticium candelabrum]|uniref:uncharacterized protein LOC134188660 n=1 Tax=Corticium candelabrum TaxID=121492 RepID=UPI002E266B48|nr:uncharacterized protein LOC134188660 [Corticium candelabrum]
MASAVRAGTYCVLFVLLLTVTVTSSSDGTVIPCRRNPLRPCQCVLQDRTVFDIGNIFANKFPVLIDGPPTPPDVDGHSYGYSPCEPLGNCMQWAKVDNVSVCVYYPRGWGAAWWFNYPLGTTTSANYTIYQMKTNEIAANVTYSDLYGSTHVSFVYNATADQPVMKWIKSIKLATTPYFQVESNKVKLTEV